MHEKAVAGCLFAIATINLFIQVALLINGNEDEEEEPEEEKAQKKKRNKLPFLAIALAH